VLLENSRTRWLSQLLLRNDNMFTFMRPGDARVHQVRSYGEDSMKNIARHDAIFLGFFSVAIISLLVYWNAYSFSSLSKWMHIGLVVIILQWLVKPLVTRYFYVEEQEDDDEESDEGAPGSQ